MAKQTLWSGRFEGEMDESTFEFTKSLHIDGALAFYDMMGSLAHAKMLRKCKIIPKKDADKIVKGLKNLLEDFDRGELEYDDSLEDIHSNIEFLLTESIGPSGGMLHTGRSRNDQVATDYRMYLRDEILEKLLFLSELISALAEVASANRDAIMPGFTHMQHAQPVTLAQHLLAHAFRFTRDAYRLIDAYERMNLCPLGSAALAGTTHPIDREMTAEALGFYGPTQNSMDSVSDRDFVTELLYCASQISIHLSSMAEELVLWSSQEFGFIEMDDRYSTGSSIMPQKKNSDVAELIRGKTGTINGSLFSMLMLTKGLPLTYNRDLQEDKAGAMDALAEVGNCLVMMQKMVSTMKVNRDVMLAKVKSGFINATDLADYLAAKGVPFREAHGIVGETVRYCIAKGKNLEDLGIKEFKKFSPKIEKDVYAFIDIANCVERRTSAGGTSSSSVDAQLKRIGEEIATIDAAADERIDSIEKCWKDLMEKP